MKKYFSLLLVLAMCLVACNGKNSEEQNEKSAEDSVEQQESFADDFSATPEDLEEILVEVVRFDRALLNINPNDAEPDIKQLYADYEAIMPIYVEGVLGLDAKDTLRLTRLYADFLRDTIVAHTNHEIRKQFADIKAIQQELNEGFTRLHYLYPNWEIPKLFFFISGFNLPIFQYKNWIGVGVDMYLGSDYKYYSQIAHDYQKPCMDKKFIAGDVLNYYISQHIPYTSKENRLLENMLYRGKQIFLLSLLLPEFPKWEIMGYTKEQWDWCIQYEQQIWNKIMDKRDLFKTESMVKTSYLNDGPFTAEISQESPGRLGIWVGWRIIDSYMRHNEEVTLQELMEDGDAQKILEKSFYKP